MNREELKKHITNFRLNLPQGVKFSVIAQSSAVLESSKDLHCEYLYVGMERPGYNWARTTYGEMETRLEGEWVGNGWLKVYPCYDEEHLVMVDGIPCQYVGETNPFQNDPMLERSVPKLEDYMPQGERGKHIRKMADILSTGMTEENGFINMSDEAVEKALLVVRPKLDESVALMAKGVIADGYLTGIANLADGMKESRSASKALFPRPSLKDTPHSQPQDWKRGVFRTSEYRGSLVRCSEDQLGLTDDLEHNRRQYNNASLRVKVAYKRRLAAWARALGKESLTAQCTVTKDNDGRWLSRRTHLATMEDHTVDSIAVARMHRPGMASTEPVYDAILDLGPLDADGKPQLPKEVHDTIMKYVGEEEKKEGEE